MDRPKDQPHAIAHVLQPTLWGENQKREPVSITADAQRMVPPARGPSPGAPKGIRSSARHGRRCGDACPVLALLRRADPGEWSLCATSGRSETAAWARTKVKFRRDGLRLVIERRGGWDGGGTVMPTPPSASRECRGSSAVPTLQGEAFQFGDNFINDRTTDYGSSRRATRLDVSVTGSICRENTYDEFRG